jgi:hypothetical protein
MSDYPEPEHVEQVIAACPVCGEWSNPYPWSMVDDADAEYRKHYEEKHRETAKDGSTDGSR